MAELQCVQIEITKAYGQSEWRDDLKQTMMKAGAENRGIVFLFSDAQVKWYFKSLTIIITNKKEMFCQ